MHRCAMSLRNVVVESKSASRTKRATSSSFHTFSPNGHRHHIFVLLSSSDHNLLAELKTFSKFSYETNGLRIVEPRRSAMSLVDLTSKCFQNGVSAKKVSESAYCVHCSSALESIEISNCRSGWVCAAFSKSRHHPLISNSRATFVVCTYLRLKAEMLNPTQWL